MREFGWVEDTVRFTSVSYDISISSSFSCRLVVPRVSTDAFRFQERRRCSLRPPPPQPVATAPAALALPGSSAPAVLPSALPRSGGGVPAPATPVQEVLEESDEDEENWEEVTTTNAVLPQSELSQQLDEEMDDIFGDGFEDADDFGKQLELEMSRALEDGLAEDEDEDDDMEPVVIPEDEGPISMEDLANANGGLGVGQPASEDDYSSSDDSDEEY
ncbi:hypothetical protein NMY22_g6717 [Coprinellus aureogranulatus]|nr:hypothetical protein NMY22_g6717 [Coprinellus aureogranulatus]